MYLEKYKNMKKVNENKTERKDLQKEVDWLKGHVKVLDDTLMKLVAFYTEKSDEITDLRDTVVSVADNSIQVAKKVTAMQDDIYSANKAKSSINGVIEDQEVFNRFMNEKFHQLNLKIIDLDEKVSYMNEKVKKIERKLDNFENEDLVQRLQKKIIDNIKYDPKLSKILSCQYCDIYVKQFKKNFNEIADTISIITDNNKLIGGQFLEIRNELDYIMELDVIKNSEKESIEKFEEIDSNLVIRYYYAVLYINKQYDDESYEYIIHKILKLKNVKLVYICFLMDENKLNQEELEKFEENYLHRISSKTVEFVLNDDQLDN